MMTKDDLKDYLVRESNYTQEVVDAMDSYSLVNAWLQWNGILGYTNDILDIMQAAFNNMDELRNEIY